MSNRKLWLLVSTIGIALSLIGIPGTILTHQPFVVTALFLFGATLCVIGFLLWWLFPPWKSL